MFGRIIFLFAVSQLYWAWRGYLWMSRRVRSVPLRILISVAVVALHFVLFQTSLGSWRMGSQPVRLTAREIFWARGASARQESAYYPLIHHGKRRHVRLPGLADPTHPRPRVQPRARR